MVAKKNRRKISSKKKFFRPKWAMFYVVCKISNFHFFTYMKYQKTDLKYHQLTCKSAWQNKFKLYQVTLYQVLLSREAVRRVYYLGKKNKPTDLYINLLSQLKKKYENSKFHNFWKFSIFFQIFLRHVNNHDGCTASQKYQKNALNYLSCVQLEVTFKKTVKKIAPKWKIFD